MSFEITVKSKHEKHINVELKGRPYMDNIIEIGALQLAPGDTLTVSVDASISIEVDGKCNYYRDKYEYEFKGFKKSQTVKFIRFTKLRKKARIDYFESFPPLQTIYRPEWNANEQ